MARTADKLIAQIKQDIADGTLGPGDQLEEAELADRFGVSRTPIREAIRSLVDSGILETRPRKGAIVRCLTATELLDLFDVAAELEGMACRLAANAMTEAHVGAMQSALAACEKAVGDNDTRAYSKANLEFHATIHLAAGNHWLVDQLGQIELRINSYRAMPYEVRGRIEQSVAEHVAIYSAILAGEGEKARELMRDHVLLQGKRLPSLIKSLENTNSLLKNRLGAA